MQKKKNGRLGEMVWNIIYFITLKTNMVLSIIVFVQASRGPEKERMKRRSETSALQTLRAAVIYVTIR